MRLIYMTVMVSISGHRYGSSARRHFSPSRFRVIQSRFYVGFRLALRRWFVWGWFDAVAGFFAHADGGRLGSCWWLHGNVIGHRQRCSGGLLRWRFHRIVWRNITRVSSPSSCWPITTGGRISGRRCTTCVSSLLKRLLCVNSISWRNADCKHTSHQLHIMQR